jgi:hypothetical protein
MRITMLMPIIAIILKNTCCDHGHAYNEPYDGFKNNHILVGKNEEAGVYCHCYCED